MFLVWNCHLRITILIFKNLIFFDNFLVFSSYLVFIHQTDIWICNLVKSVINFCRDTTKTKSSHQITMFSSTWDTFSRHSKNGNSKKKGYNFWQNEIDWLLELTDKLLPINGKEWEELARKHYTFFPKHNLNGDLLKHKFYNIAYQGPPTGASDYLAYVRYAKAIKCRIIDDTDGSTRWGVAETSENFDRKFADGE